jgi:hypothetical protein
MMGSVLKAKSFYDPHNFMNDKCELIDSTHPCRCAKKTRGFIQAGYVDPQILLFARDRVLQVREAALGILLAEILRAKAPSNRSRGRADGGQSATVRKPAKMLRRWRM